MLQTEEEFVLVAGGGAIEIAVSQSLSRKQLKGPYTAVAMGLEIIPRTLAQNCGPKPIQTLTALRAQHPSHSGDGVCVWSIDGESSEIVDMNVKAIWEPLAVKMQTYETAEETAILLLRIEDIVSGSKKRKDNEPMNPAAAAAQE